LTDTATEVVRGCPIPLHPGWRAMLEAVYEVQGEPEPVLSAFRRISDRGSKSYRTLKEQIKRKTLIATDFPGAPLQMTERGLEVLNADRWSRGLDPHPPKPTYNERTTPVMGLTAIIEGESHPKKVTLVSDDSDGLNAMLIEQLREAGFEDLADAFESADMVDGKISAVVATYEIGDVAMFLEEGGYQLTGSPAQEALSKLVNDAEEQALNALSEAQEDSDDDGESDAPETSDDEDAPSSEEE
jgi:hypothetical protein